MTVGIVATTNFFVKEENGFFIMTPISFLNTIKTEKSVATWRMTDSSRKSPSIPKNLLSRTKCPLEEIGKNSLIPCKIAKTITPNIKKTPKDILIIFERKYEFNA